MDALGNPTSLHPTGGEAHDLAGADALLQSVAAPTLIADKDYDAEARVLAPLREAGKAVVISHRRNRTEQREYVAAPSVSRGNTGRVIEPYRTILPESFLPSGVGL